MTQPPARQSMDVYWEAWRLLDRDFYGDKPDTTAHLWRYPRHGRVLWRSYTYFVGRGRDLERDELRGKFGGIGVTWNNGRGLLHPVPEQPAERAGIRERYPAPGRRSGDYAADECR